MNEGEEIKETIELTKFLTKDQIETIIDMAVSANVTGKYEAKVEVQTLIDALRTRGIRLENRFEAEGNKAIPKGTYKFLHEEDLGGVNGTCQNYSCGHPIRYAEHIQHIESGRRFVVGNVCIGHILGEHDLINVAVSLLSKISRRVDKLNKAKKITKLLGTIPARMRLIDPERFFTADEQKFFDDVDKAKSSITIKRAEEIMQIWDRDRLNVLETKVGKEFDRRSATKAQKKEEIKSWTEFMEYKKWDIDRRGRRNDFIDSCIEDIKVHDELSQFRKEKLQQEKDTYDRIHSADPELLIDIDNKEDRLFMAKMLNHAKTCTSYFVTSVLERAIRFDNERRLSPGQIRAIKNGDCKHCGKRII